MTRLSTLPHLFSAHLSPDVVTRLADGAPATRRERDHLADCQRCRAEVDAVRALHATARSLGGPPATDALLDRIRARVADGGAVILPAAPASTDIAPARRRAVPAFAAAALAIAAGALWFARPTPDLAASATSGELRFTPAAPHAGDSVAVEYRAPAALSGETVLSLRARYRSMWDEPYANSTSQRTAATLRRGDDGVFRASIVLPDSAVFAVYAVEDTAAHTVDDHERRLWELLAHGADGRPTSDAMRERENDLIGRNVEQTLVATRERIRLYPNDPDAWATLSAITQFARGVLPDSARIAHRARLAQLSDAWSTRATVPFAVVDGLLAYAAQVTDRTDSLNRSVRARWSAAYDSATAVDPTGPVDRARVVARWSRLNGMGFAGPDSARTALALAERFWKGQGHHYKAGAQRAEQLARQASDTTILTWADRWAANEPGREYAYAGALALPATRDAAASRLVAMAARLLEPDDARRPLELTRAQAAIADSAHARRVLGMAADARLAAGDRAGARAIYARATDGGWQPSLFRRAAAAALADGDTAAALPLLARIAADPSAGARVADSLGSLARGSGGGAAWARAVADARTAMRDAVLAGAVDDALPSRVPLHDATGAATTLADLRGGRVAVVAFWSSVCYPARGEVLAFDSLGAALARVGAVLVPVTSEAPSPAVTAFLREARVTRPVYFDDDGAARRAFGQWATPEYYVVDRRGRVRFREGSADALLAEAAALGDDAPRPIASTTSSTPSTTHPIPRISR